MPAVSSRGGSGRRRTVNEINMVPFIDVMLVLLIIFMVSAPLMTPGVIDLPTVGKAQRQPDHIIEVRIDSQEQLRLKLDNKRAGTGSSASAGSGAAAADEGDTVQLSQLAKRVRELQADPSTSPVIISADKGVKYEVVVKVMDTLQRAGVQRVGLSVRTTGS